MENTSPQLLDFKVDWLPDPDINRLFDCLEAAGIEGRFVGGCVRDSLIGRPVNDYDIAVDHLPETVMAALIKASIKVIPTGIDHGTVTAVVNHRPFELTTLRKDIETDGRHAVVEFCNDWFEDAARRDFTMNALYMTRKGQIYDYFGGLEDVRAGVVRFVGDASLRMEEDCLRLLRFFRFSAHYSKSNYDKDVLAVCADFAPKLRNLAAERIWQEWSKILKADQLKSTLVAMKNTNIFDYLYQDASLSVLEEDMDRLARLGGLADFDHPNIIALSCLHWGTDKTKAKAAAKFLRLSNKEYKFLAKLFTLREELTILNTPSFYKCYDGLGADTVRAIAYINRADQQDGPWDDLISYAEKTKDPIFPLLGRDVINKGIPAGPRVGQYLFLVKERWIKSGFSLDHAACLKELKNMMEES